MFSLCGRLSLLRAIEDGKLCITVGVEEQSLPLPRLPRV